MKKISLFTLGALLLAVGFWLSVAPQAAYAEGDTAKPLAIGDQVADFTLPDSNSQDRSLTSLQGTNGTLIFFTSTRCPMIKAYAERLDQITADYTSKGINVIAINSNTTEPADEIKQHATDHKLAYTVLRDADSKIADRFNAQVTPEIYLLDAKGKLVYHGGVDDNRAADQVKNNYLRLALDAMLAGKPIERTETKAFGCSVKRAA